MSPTVVLIPHEKIALELCGELVKQGKTFRCEFQTTQPRRALAKRELNSKTGLEAMNDRRDKTLGGWAFEVIA